MKLPQSSSTHTLTHLLTVDKLLLLLRADADQVGVELLAALLGLRPGVSLSKVEVTAAHELQPAFSTALHSYTHKHTHRNTLRQTFSILVSVGFAKWLYKQCADSRVEQSSPVKPLGH